MPICFRLLRTPCFEPEYISHCGWSKPMWQVWQACGCWASFFEKVWRVWQASQEALPCPPVALTRSRVRPRSSGRACGSRRSSSALDGRHGRWWRGGHGLHGRPGRGVPPSGRVDLGAVALVAGVGVGSLASEASASVCGRCWGRRRTRPRPGSGATASSRPRRQVAFLVAGHAASEAVEAAAGRCGEENRCHQETDHREVLCKGDCGDLYPEYNIVSSVNFRKNELGWAS